MKVYIKHKDTIVEIIAFVLFVVFLDSIFSDSLCDNNGNILLLVTADFVFLVKYPFYVTVTVENNTLQYKKLFKNVSISLDSIYYIHCEPYKKHLRYRINESHIRLAIITDDGVTRELNDILDGEAPANDRLHKTHTDIPLVKLCDYIKEKINYSPEGGASE